MTSQEESRSGAKLYKPLIRGRRIHVPSPVHPALKYAAIPSMILLLLQSTEFRRISSICYLPVAPGNPSPGLANSLRWSAAAIFGSHRTYINLSPTQFPPLLPSSCREQTYRHDAGLAVRGCTSRKRRNCHSCRLNDWRLQVSCLHIGILLMLP